MSAGAHDGHTTAHYGHDDHAHASAPHFNARDYVIGFVLSIILTVIPFWLVMGEVLDSTTLTVGLIIVFAVAQIFVHMIYFLHMNRKSEGGWTVLALIFTVIVLAIAIAGSIWVMYHLDTNMMPGHLVPASEVLHEVP